MIARAPASASTTGTVFYHTDHLGSTRLATDTTGTVVANYDFKPFGETSAPGSTAKHLFTGLEKDAESGLDHTWFRKYASAFGRWLSPDPLSGSVSNPQSLNRYSYVLNDGLNYVDPFGLIWI
jgi:RHS repeat-associated protein